MEKAKFAPADLNKHMATLNAYGQLFGKVLVCPQSDLLDLDYHEKAKENKMRLATPAKKYFVKATVIYKVDVDRDVNDKLVLVFNNDVDLTFPIVGNEKPNVQTCTPEKINEAIRDFNSNKKLTFFADVEAVTKVVTNYNERTAKELEGFAEECMMFAQTLRSVNDIANKEAKAYADALKTIE